MGKEDSIYKEGVAPKKGTLIYWKRISTVPAPMTLSHVIKVEGGYVCLSEYKKTCAAYEYVKVSEIIWAFADKTID